MRFLELSVTTDILREARSMADDMGAIRNSITEGDANYEAFIAELSVARHLGQKVAGHKDYDMFWVPEGDVLSVDVKSKRRTVEPTKFFDCHIADTSLHQKCDSYIFTSSLQQGDTYRVWALGWITKERFMRIARRVRKGEKDGPFTETADARKCKVTMLNEMPWAR